MMCRCELAASCTSLKTCSDAFEWVEKIKTKTLLCWMARVISPAKERPGWTSRGAIQHRIPLFSSALQTASAIGLSCDECEMKTSCGMIHYADRALTNGL